MAGITSLQTPQPKTEIKRNQIMGLFEDTVEYLVRGAPPNEGPLPQMPELKVPAGLAESGSLSGFQNPRRIEHVSVEARSQVEAELMKAHREAIMRAPLEAKRARINELNLIPNSDYTGSMDREGNVHTYHQANADKKEAEIAATHAARIQKEREEKLAQSRGRQVNTKGAVGAVNLNTDFEDRNLSGKPG